MHRHLSVAQLERSLVARMARENHAAFIDHDRLSPAKFVDGLGDRVHRHVVVQPRPEVHHDDRGKRRHHVSEANQPIPLGPRFDLARPTDDEGHSVVSATKLNPWHLRVKSI